MDTGVTMKHLLETLQAGKPKEIRIATLLLKQMCIRDSFLSHFLSWEMPLSGMEGGMDSSFVSFDVIDRCV